MVELFAYVKVSDYRMRVLVDIGDKIKFPSDIAKSTGIRNNHVSTALKSLRNKGLVELLNEEQVRGRLYKLTKKGKRIRECIKKYT